MQSMDVFNDSVELLINELSSVADGKTEVKMLDLFNRITLDAVAKVTTKRVCELYLSVQVQVQSSGSRSCPPYGDLSTNYFW